MSGIKSFSAGIKYGIIAGLIYTVLLFLQYTYGASTPITFVIFKVATYLLILIIFYFAGVARRKELGGFIEFKDVFQTIFITIVITEIIYALFTYIYLTYINPQFMDTFVNNTMKFMERMNMPDADIDEKIKEMQDSAANKPTFGNALAGIGMWIIIDSIFGLIFSGIIKRQKPAFPTT